MLAIGLVSFEGSLRSQDAFGSWAQGFNHPTNSFTYTHPSFPATTIAWPPTFKAINLAVIPSSDNVIVWDNRAANQANYGQAYPWQQRFSVGNPEAPASFVNYVVYIDDAGSPDLGDLFCAGHCWLPDGRLFVAGGNSRYPTSTNNYYEGSQFAGIWNPTLMVAPDFGWTLLPRMNLKRWYPTVTLTGDNKIMVSGGVTRTDIPYSADPAVNTYEVWDLNKPGNIKWETVSTSGVPFLYQGPTGSSQVLGEYPRMHLVSTNEIFMSGMVPQTNRVDFRLGHPVGQQRAWETTTGWPAATTLGLQRGYGASVLLPNVGNTLGGRDLVMLLGGGQYATTSVTATSEVADGAANPTQWASLGNMNYARMFPNAVLLPNGDTLVMGGSSTYSFSAGAAPIYVAETYDKKNGWLEEAAQASPRMYHSTAGLLPSGRVVSAGGDVRTSDYEVFTPDYLGSGATRPVFAGSWAGPGFLDFDFGEESLIQHAALPVGVSISRVVLMRPCSVTHHSDMDQRYVELLMVTDGDGELPVNTVLVRMPPTPNQSGTTRGSVVAPPGFYMAFLITSAGTPSVAKWVKLS